MRLGKYLSSLTKPELELIITNANFTDDEQKIFELLTKDRCITEIAIISQRQTEQKFTTNNGYRMEQLEFWLLSLFLKITLTMYRPTQKN